MRYSICCFLNLCLATTLFAEQKLPALRAPLADNVVDLAAQVKDALPWKHHPWDTRGGPSVSDAYAALFKKAGDAGLSALQTGQNDSIAVQAAWREVALTVPEEEPAARIRPDQKKLDWFLGFLEGRTRVKAPAWWAESVHNADANRRNNIHFYSQRSDGSPYHIVGLDSLFAPRETSISTKGESVTIRVGDQEFQISKSLLKKDDQGHAYGGLSAAFGKSNCYVAVHGHAGTPFRLYCFDRETGTERWQSGVWGCWWGNSTGRPHCFVSVTEQNDSVVVFGEAGIGIHVEAFATQDGANLFRFASSY